MRTRNALKNIIFSVGSQCFLLVIGLVLRRFLLNNFDVELVAYDSLLSNIFALLAVVGMGSDSMFQYRMYKAFAEDDKERINQLISMFRKLYQALAVVMAVLYIVVFFFLPVIFAGKVRLWGYFRIMYALYALSAVSSYVFGYWQTLLIAGQQMHKIVTVETSFQAMTQIAKVVILWTTRSFMLYLLMTFISGVVVQVLVANKSKKAYPEVKIVPATLRECREEGMLHELRDLFLVRLSSTIMYSTDSILITLLVDVWSTALYSNYNMIATRMSALFNRLISPMSATIAEVVNQEDKETSYQVYRSVDLYGFFLASILGICYVVVFQPAISVFFGERFLLPQSFVFAYAAQYYINMKYQPVFAMRLCFGEYQTERTYAFWGMLLNLVLSILFGKWWGLAGIILGTVISSLGLWHGYLLIVEKNFYHKSLVRCWVRELGFAALCGVELAVTRWLTAGIPYTFAGVLLCGTIGVAVPTAINIVVFLKNPAFQSLFSHFKAVIARRRKP